MEIRHAPTLLPAAAFAAGSLTAFQLPFLSVPLLAVLALLGLALGRRAGICLAFLAFGLLAAAVRLGLPGGPLEGLDRDRPVEATVRVAGHWLPDDDPDGGWFAPARLLRVRQGSRIAEPPLDVTVYLPGTDEPPPFGSTLRIKGFLARSAGFANRTPVPPGPWRLRAKSRSLMEIESGPGAVAGLSNALRRRVEEAYAAAGPAGTESRGGRRQGKALARALVLGDASGLPLEWKRGLRLTGVYHLLSVSGVHVALVAGAVWLLGGWLPRALRLLLMLAAIGLYLLLVGPLPALIRAAVMGLLAITALLAERPPAAANALGWAVLLLVLDRPDVVLLPAFQLTVSATAGLLVVAPPLAERWCRRLPVWLARSLAPSVGAQLLTLPWALPRFHTLAPLGPLLNLPAVPWTGLTLGASLLWTAAALAAPELAGSMLPVLDFLAAPFSWPSRTRPEIWCALPLAASPALAWLLTGVLGLVLWLPLRRALVAAAGIVVVLACARQASHGVEVVMLDVGQGDSILLRDGDRAVLVDGGGWRNGDLGGRVLLPALLAEGIRDLEAVVLTHPDLDHCAGLVDIASYLPVKELWTAPGWDPESCVGRFRTLQRRILWAGENAQVGRWRFTALHPEAGDRTGLNDLNDLNDRSLVLRAEALGRRVLLTGDIERRAEYLLLDRYGRDELRADLLKVAHHGSRTSTTSAFLEAVKPRLALISAGVNNLYYHPAPDVVERLEEHGARVLRTDQSGMIRIAFGEGGEDGRTRIELPGVPR
jgi:competence protein ComEC